MYKRKRKIAWTCLLAALFNKKNKHKKKIALALLLIVLTIYAACLKLATVPKDDVHTVPKDDVHLRALEYRKAGLRLLNDGVKQTLSMKYGSPINRKPGVVDVAILIPVTTRKIKTPSLQTLPLMTESIPSIIATVESNFNYKVYVGTEQNDFLATQLDEIKSMSAGNVDIIPMIVKGGTENRAVNEIARQAYKDGVEFMCRINDDTTFITKYWTSFGIKTLANFKPTNVGVVGPTCRQGLTDILTHDMVHRTHMDIFFYYYPPVLENWWIDNWIDSIYKPNRSIKLETWEVFHSIEYGTRYTVDYSIEILSEVLITIGNFAVESYSRGKSSCQTSRIISYCLFGSEPSSIEGAVANSKIASRIFPEWIVRIYHDDTVPSEALQSIRSENVQLVNITTNPPFEPKEIWNLFVATDPCLERYLIRSTDSRLTAREKAAVDQWIDSGKHFHIMRDAPFHIHHSVPNGLWGGTRDAVPDMMSIIHKYMVNRAQYGNVQQFLNKEIWQLAKMSVFHTFWK